MNKNPGRILYTAHSRGFKTFKVLPEIVYLLNVNVLSVKPHRAEHTTEKFLLLRRVRVEKEVDAAAVVSDVILYSLTSYPINELL